MLFVLMVCARGADMLLGESARDYVTTRHFIL